MIKDMGKPRICLIYTGGTIGMVRTQAGTLRPPENPEDFLDVAPELKKFVDLEFVPLMNKDSTNMNPNDWSEMAKAIYDRKDYGYRGFVIAHGTDTMHFSASAVAFALGKNINFPVVFTGAQTTPEVLHGDARINLVRACKVALTEIAEVVISFGDYVWRGCRAQKKDERRFDAFESPAFFPLAYIMEEIVIQPVAWTRDKKTGEVDFKPKFADNILQVSLIPGLEPELLLPIMEANECHGVILQSFGAGNVPDEKPFSFEEVIGRATIKNRPVIITSQFPANSTLHTAYEPGQKAVEAGAIPTGNMTGSAAAAKFRWILVQVEDMIKDDIIDESEKLEKVRAMMQTIYIDEMDE